MLILAFSFSYQSRGGSCLSPKPFKKQANKLPFLLSRGVGKTENSIASGEKLKIDNSLAAKPFYVPVKVLASIL